MTSSTRLVEVRQHVLKQNDAVATLEDLSGKVDGLDKVACLFLIKRSKTR